MDNQQITLAAAGMATDTRYKYQPKGKARLILNGVLESALGDNPALINEIGNQLCAQVKKTYTIIGAHQLDDNEFVIFSTNGVDSEIGLFNQNTCLYFEFLNEPCLNFQLDRRIVTEFRILKGCERIIYFTDGFNTYKSINLDDVANYYKNGVFQCGAIEMTPPLTRPTIKVNKVLDFGGTLKLGTYMFRLRYLDDDFNPTNWQLLTKPAPIVDDNLLGDYFGIDGGVNIVTSSSETGSVPPSTKSIELYISDLDSTFKYYQLAVIAKTEGLNTITEAYILPEVSIGGSDDIYVYSGPNPNSDIKTDPSALLVDQDVIDIVQDHVQHDSRMFVAGLSYDKYDYAAVQRATEKIKAKWIAKAERWKDVKAGGAKTPKSYLESRSFMRDEVYAFSAVGTHKKGWKTPAFHVPGRAAITDPGLVNLGNDLTMNDHYRKPCPNFNWDRASLQIVNTLLSNNSNIRLSEVRHLGFTELDLGIGSPVPVPNPPTVERWKVFNTAINEKIDFTSSTQDPLNNAAQFPSRGYMAYYQSEKDYPDTVDCDGVRIYPEGKIRHHKFPDTTLVPCYIRTQDQIFLGNQFNDEFFPDYQETAFILPMGVEFDLQDFLNDLPDDIKNDFTWEICVADRTFNKTVLDKGYLISANVTYKPKYELVLTSPPGVFPPVYESQVEFVEDMAVIEPLIHRAVNPQTKISTFLSPRETFYKDNLNGSYIKNERTVFQNPLSLTYDGPEDYIVEILDLSRVYQKIQQMDYNNVYHFANRAIDENKFIKAPLNPLAKTIDTIEADISPLYSSTGVIANFIYTKDMKVMTTFDPLVSSTYFRNAFAKDKVTWTNTDNYRNQYHLIYSSIKTTQDVYNNLATIRYRPLESDMTLKPSTIDPNAKLFSSYSGDTHIAYLAHRLATITSGPNEKIKRIIPFSGALPNPDFPTLPQISNDNYICGFYESDVNSELRHASVEPDKRYLKENLDSNLQISKFLDNFYLDTDPNSNEDPELFTKEYFGYNKDYSAIPDAVTYFPISNKYDYCTKCDNKFPFRIKYSEKSFQDSVTDKYKIFLSGNYRDLDGSTGPITALVKNKEELYCFTKRALFHLPTRPQTLTTDSSVIYLGTGDVLSMPPRRINDLDYAYMGTSDKFSTKTTEFGTMWIDSQTGKIFNLGQGVEEISAQGMRNFFENNLSLSLLSQTEKEFSGKYPYLSPTHPLGIGYSITYDPRFKRVIVSKRDYELVKKDNVVFSPETGYLLNGKAISFDSEYFEDKSFTISYALADKTWASFHSYIPEFMFNGENTFFTTKTNEIWEHNKGDYQTYYGNKYDFIVDVVAAPNPNMTSVFGPIKVLTQVFNLDPATKQQDQLYDLTFDRMLCYSSDSSTGLQTLQLQTPWSSVLNTNNTTTYYEPKGKAYNINDMFNIADVANKNPLTSNWNAIGNFYPIDVISNPAVINTNKNPFTVSRMVDDYMSIRLYFKPEKNYKIVFDGLIYKFKPLTR